MVVTKLSQFFLGVKRIKLKIHLLASYLSKSLVVLVADDIIASALLEITLYFHASHYHYNIKCLISSHHSS